MRRFLSALAFFLTLASAQAQDFAIPDNLPHLNVFTLGGVRLSGVTGSGSTVVLQTSPTFLTSITAPQIYGGTATNSTLTLTSTSNGSPSGDTVNIQAGGQTMLQALQTNSGQVTVGRGTFVPWTGSLMEWRAGTNERFALSTNNLLTTGISFQTFNDAINANQGLEFRASQTLFSQGGVIIANGTAGIDPGIGNLNVGGHIACNAPATKTTTYSQVANDCSLIFNGSGSITLTLQAASSYQGRLLFVKTIAAQTVVSASSNVIPLAGGSAGTAILSGTAGKWALLQSDGTNWNIMASN